ncbi:uncharacterized protein ARMOST_22218 [Armillaria ostoyae]|uniref:Reverse transcriptase domain-containing protein n=1 Tax=Armillaria ostoyae TaxID=47428 RepID=A0A284SC83_ARMOS|nr:uncharacterized protein ARMOST_22218 [Armillaria ostoyae]
MVVPPDMQYPPPAWEFCLITNEQIERAFKQMKPLKATKLGTIPNSVLIHCADLLASHIGPVYRATFTMEEYPDVLSVMNTIILHKPGKSDYQNPNAYRPIILSDGWGWGFHATLNQDLRLGGQKTILTFDDFKSIIFDVTNGLDQGDPLSQILYIIYNSSTIKRLQNGEEGLFFIDDKAILMQGKTFTETYQKIKDIMERSRGILEWAAEHNCEYGMEKFQLVDFTTKTREAPPRPNAIAQRWELAMGTAIQISQHNIHPNPVAKFLGVYINAGLRWKEQGAAAIKKGNDWIIQF